MHAEHRGMLKAIEARAGPPRTSVQSDSYLDSGHPIYFVRVPERRRIARAWLAAHKSLPTAEVLAVVSSLIAGRSHEEKTLGAILLGYADAARATVTPGQVDAWLDHLHGWAEVDSLCANVFKAEEMAADWPAWRDGIVRLMGDTNINKRRAALVLLTGPTHYASDDRFHALAYEAIEALKAERDIKITKPVSWLLRSMSDQRPDAVRRYVEAERASLPAIAVRETLTKLNTGTKSGRGSKART
jgi:3-methyladenine DNA glycosylase AlkD